MRQCSICGVEKAYSEFHKKPTGRDGRSTYCKKCQVEKTKIWRNKNPDQVKKQGSVRLTFCRLDTTGVIRGGGRVRNQLGSF